MKMFSKLLNLIWSGKPKLRLVLPTLPRILLIPELPPLPTDEDRQETRTVVFLTRNVKSPKHIHEVIRFEVPSWLVNTPLYRVLRIPHARRICIDPIFDMSVRQLSSSTGRGHVQLAAEVMLTMYTRQPSSSGRFPAFAFFDYIEYLYCRPVANCFVDMYTYSSTVVSSAETLSFMTDI